ncbi:phosphoglycolate phosphatase [Rhodovulum imhoffii]|uniref:phosphoglycolate phosphatase n=1 Tax=Rhodovulum imhoffii TaxID=365340 RepID=A0A2T5BWG8_9RHOB|nr:HAD-IA family hydrolase [Rhodovulum imhoffii]MBK5935049.1 haloacid dehalogenase [Rhodovulum imhoffii]PTN03986.1 phosphoglycolate phosphatase [Rhodovulum imhoffii]
MPTVIFDLDGTLADTSGDLIAAANACFGALGFGAPLKPKADAATAFQGGRAMLRKGFERVNGRADEALIEAQFPLFLRQYEAAIDVHTQLYPGVREAMDRLRSAGVRLGVCTNKPERLAEILLTRLGVRGLFGALVGADTLPVRKPDPAPYRAAVNGAGGQMGRSVLVGDTVTDRETARAAGVPCVLVTFGPAGQGVADLKPEGLLDHYDDLEAVLAPLLG